MDTVCAISTPNGVGAISIVRITGDKAKQYALMSFKCKSIVNNELTPRYMYLGQFSTPNFNEQCMLVYFKNPNSYTGEDLVEIQCHGGVLVTNEILSQLVANGCTLAPAGEFTKRAFINGKMSLDQAEGVIDIINSESQSQIRAGYSLLNKNLCKRLESIQQNLTDILSEIEVVFDYPEHDDEINTINKINIVANNTSQSLQQLIKSSGTGMKVKNGCRVLLIGKPNVGKSSIMNAMLDCDRAIVTDIEGTTRDLLEETYLYNGVKFMLTDTAGVRQSQNLVEKIGIEKTLNMIDQADIILFVIDSSKDIEQYDKQIIGQIKDKNTIIIANKSDIATEMSINSISSQIDGKIDLKISAANNQGITELKELIYNKVIDQNIINADLMITNQRHVDALNRANQICSQIITDSQNYLDLELLVIDIKSLWLVIGEITGQTNNEDIISNIFSKFCCGK